MDAARAHVVGLLVRAGRGNVWVGGAVDCLIRYELGRV